jgi:hypothetical protein
MSAAQPDKRVTASLDQVSEMLPILNAKPGDVFAHATDRGNYRNEDGWYDTVVYKGMWDPDTSDKALIGDIVSDQIRPLQKGWLIFHWAPDGTGNGRMLYQAGGMNGLALVTKFPEVDIQTCGGVPLGVALPLEACWGMRHAHEFEGPRWTRMFTDSGTLDQEHQEKQRKHLKELREERQRWDAEVEEEERKAKKARRMMPERAN